MDIATERWEQYGAHIFSPSEGRMICQMSEPEAQFVEHRPLEVGSPHWEEAMARARAIENVPLLLALTKALNDGNPVEDLREIAKGLVHKIEGVLPTPEEER